MSGLRAGGYSGTSSTDLDIIPLIKTQEDAINSIHTLTTVREISFVPAANCTIKINDGSSITVKANIPYSNNEVLVYKLVIETNSVDYYIAYNY